MKQRNNLHLKKMGGGTARLRVADPLGTGPLLRYSITNEVTFLSDDVTDRYFLFRVTDRVTEVNFWVRYSVTLLVRYSVTPLLRYSVTPLLRYSVTPLLHYSIHSIVLLLIPIIDNTVHLSSPTPSIMQQCKMAMYWHVSHLTENFTLTTFINSARMRHRHANGGDTATHAIT